MNGWTPEEINRIDEINRMEWRAASQPTLWKMTTLLQKETGWNFFHAAAVAQYIAWKYSCANGTAKAAG
jgi:hypothetical protein